MSTQYRATKALDEFLKALKERKKDKGDEVSEILCNTALSKVNPECTTLNQFIMDQGWRFIPPPEGGEPKDPKESEDAIVELKDTFYRLWTRKLKEGEYDPGAPAPDLTPEPEPEPEVEDAEVEVKDQVDTPEEEAEDIASAVEEKEEMVDTKAPVKSAEKSSFVEALDLHIEEKLKEHKPSGGGADTELRADFEKMKKVLKMQAEKIKSLEAALESNLLS